MGEDGEGPGAAIDYADLVRQAFLDLVRKVLARAAEEGLPGDHHFYLTFATAHDGVELSPRLRQKFPEEMTVVLQHQYWNLQADAAGFSVTLRFGGAPERVVVPWPALRSFTDPSVDFGLQLRPADAQAEASTEATTREQNPPALASVKKSVARSPKVVNLGAFRRKPGGGATG
jgi:hypothetical protein